MKPVKVPESVVHKAILSYLRAVLPPVEAATIMHSRNEMDLRADRRSKAIAQAKAKAMGMRRGWPDLQWIGPSGRLHCIEVKASHGGRVSEAQSEVRGAIEAAGGRWALARSVDDARDALRGWGYRV